MDEHAFPKSWTVRAISEIAELGNGGTPPKANTAFWGGGKIPFVTAADLTATCVSDGRTFLTKTGLNSGKTAVCEPGDLLVGTRTRVGNCAIATNKKRTLAVPAALDPNMMGVFPLKDSGLTSEFLRWWFESIDLAELQEDGGIPRAPTIA